MGMLERAEESLRQWRRTHLSKTAVYDGKFVHVDSLHLTQAATEIDSELSTGLVVHGQSVDWLIDVADLLNNVPNAGDKIFIRTPITGYQYSDGDDPWAGYKTERYEVMNLGETCWRWHGRNNTTYRVHSKLVSK